jgi:hypothetical protein
MSREFFYKKKAVAGSGGQAGDGDGRTIITQG